MRVAILEDAVEQAKTLARWLNKAGYETLVFHDGSQFVQEIKTEPVDVLLLDWDVPGKTGIEVLKWVRETLADSVPIVMLTHHDSESDIVYGLNCGADDYLVKPAREMELLARIQAQTRKYYPESSREEKIEIGRYKLDVATRSIHVDGVNGAKDVILPEREFDLALLFFKNAGRIVTKEILLKRIWGVMDHKYDATLATYISKLRNVLELRAKNGMVISTVYNYGYRLERTQRSVDGY